MDYREAETRNDPCTACADGLAGMSFFKRRESPRGNAGEARSLRLSPIRIRSRRVTRGVERGQNGREPSQSIRPLATGCSLNSDNARLLQHPARDWLCGMSRGDCQVHNAPPHSTSSPFCVVRSVRARTSWFRSNTQSRLLGYGRTHIPTHPPALSSAPRCRATPRRPAGPRSATNVPPGRRCTPSSFSSEARRPRYPDITAASTPLLVPRFAIVFNMPRKPDSPLCRRWLEAR